MPWRLLGLFLFDSSPSIPAYGKGLGLTVEKFEYTSRLTGTVTITHRVIVDQASDADGMTLRLSNGVIARWELHLLSKDGEKRPAWLWVIDLETEGTKFFESFYEEFKDTPLFLGDDLETFVCKLRVIHRLNERMNQLSFLV